MLTYREALDRIYTLTLPVATEKVPLLSAGGRCLAGPLRAPWPLPRFDNSAMDGFAVRCADIEAATTGSPIALPIAGESAAGRPSSQPLAPGTVQRISTGAKLPDGADGIVPIERVRVESDTAQFSEPAVPGRFIRRRGEDVPQNAELFGRGTRLDPAVLAWLAMYNLTEIEVLVPPRVAILTSGDEVKPLGAPLGETDIIGANVYYLEEELKAFGCAPRLFGIAPDDTERFAAMLQKALDWGDLVVTTAGVSVGEHDVVGAAITRLGGEPLFWKVSVRPGKPMLVARFGEKPYFGLPGNPVSVCCNTELFLKPFLRRTFGIRPWETPLETMRLRGSDCPRDRARLFFVYGRAHLAAGRWSIEPLAHQSSGNLANPARGNALIVVEPGEDPIAVGEEVAVMRLTPGR